MTGLNMETAELWQTQNYGIGGHYDGKLWHEVSKKTLGGGPEWWGGSRQNNDSNEVTRNCAGR